MYRITTFLFSADAGWVQAANPAQATSKTDAADARSHFPLDAFIFLSLLGGWAPRYP
jgi:hypothetical protein